jgi:hypothetical protein
VNLMGLLRSPTRASPLATTSNQLGRGIAAKRTLESLKPAARSRACGERACHTGNQLGRSISVKRTLESLRPAVNTCGERACPRWGAQRP